MLLSLPNSLLLDLVQQWLDDNLVNVVHLAATCRRLRAIVMPQVFQFVGRLDDKKQQYGGGISPPLWFELYNEIHGRFHLVRHTDTILLTTTTTSSKFRCFTLFRDNTNKSDSPTRFRRAYLGPFVSHSESSRVEVVFQYNDHCDYCHAPPQCNQKRSIFSYRGINLETPVLWNMDDSGALVLPVKNTNDNDNHSNPNNSDSILQACRRYPLHFYQEEDNNDAEDVKVNARFVLHWKNDTEHKKESQAREYRVERGYQSEPSKSQRRQLLEILPLFPRPFITAPSDTYGFHIFAPGAWNQSTITTNCKETVIKYLKRRYKKNIGVVTMDAQVKNGYLYLHSPTLNYDCAICLVPRDVRGWNDTINDDKKKKNNRNSSSVILYILNNWCEEGSARWSVLIYFVALAADGSTLSATRAAETWNKYHDHHQYQAQNGTLYLHIPNEPLLFHPGTGQAWQSEMDRDIVALLFD